MDKPCLPLPAPVSPLAMPKENPQEIADYLIQEHGLDKAIEVAVEGAATAMDNYSLSVWREVKMILRAQKDQQETS